MLSESYNFIKSFFAQKLSRQVRELYASTLILDLAISMVAIFEPVFLYLFFSQTYGLKGTLECLVLFYLSLYSLYLFLIPVGAKFAKRFGYENSIALSTLFQIILYFSLFAMNHFGSAVFVAVIVYAIAKALYWPAYHANFARFSADGEQGREITNLYAMESFIFIIGPLIGGLILEFFGFKIIFIVASVLILASNIPMLMTKETFEPQPFGYLDAFKNTFAKENRRKFFAHWGFGEEWIVAVLWAVFMYLAANNFLGLGIISAVSTFVSTGILLFIGRLADKHEKKKILRFGIVLYFFGWFFRILTRNYLSIIMVDIYSRVTKNFISVPITVGLYNNAKNSSVMKTIVFFESSLVSGKIFAMLICYLLLQVFVPGWNSFFIFGGLLTLFYLLFINYAKARA